MSDYAKAHSFYQEEIVVIIVMRGGMLLFPSFYKTLNNAKFGFLACKRKGEEREIIYSEIPDLSMCRLLVFVDTFIATGKTLNESMRYVRKLNTKKTDEIVCCIISSFNDNFISTLELNNLVGFDLSQTVNANGWLLPDFGGLDAGDLLIG